MRLSPQKWSKKSGKYQRTCKECAVSENTKELPKSVPLVPCQQK